MSARKDTRNPNEKRPGAEQGPGQIRSDQGHNRRGPGQSPAETKMPPLRGSEGAGLME